MAIRPLLWEQEADIVVFVAKRMTELKHQEYFLSFYCYINIKLIEDNG